MIEAPSRPARPRIRETVWGAVVLLWVLLGMAFLPGTDRWVLLRTLALGVGASGLALPLGYLTWWACRGRSTSAVGLQAACIALLLMPLIVQVGAWDAAFGKLGWLTAARGEVLKPLVGSWTAAIWIHGLAAVPQVVLILWVAGADRIPEYQQQAWLEVGRGPAFWRIQLVRLAPALTAAGVWIIVSAAREIAVTDLYQIGTLAEQVYLGYALDGAGDAVAGASSLPLMLVTLGLMALLAFRLFGWLQNLQLNSEPGQADPLVVQGLGMRTLRGGLCLLLAGVPLVNLLARASFSVVAVAGRPNPEYSLGRLCESLIRAVADYRMELFWSALIGVTSATLLLAVGLLLAVTARAHRWREAILLGSLAFLAAIPGPLLGTALLRLGVQFDAPVWNWLVDYTIAFPVLANVFFGWPVAGWLVWLVVRQTGPDQWDAARLEGAGIGAGGWHLGVRPHLPALAAIWLAMAALSFGELSASQLVRPPGMDTLPRKLLGDLHAGVNELTAGIGIVVFITVLLVSWLLVARNRLNRTRVGRQ